jgi:uncharacterized membrane protein
MAIGPVQLIVLGFPEPDFHGEIAAELERLRAGDAVRVIDALAVHKDSDGEVEVAHLSNLSDGEAAELGSTVGALIGLGIEGEEGLEPGAEAGAQAAAAHCRDIAIRISDSLSVMRSPLRSTVTSCSTPVKRNGAA